VRREQSAKHGKARTNEKVRDQLCQNKEIVAAKVVEMMAEIKAGTPANDLPI